MTCHMQFFLRAREYTRIILELPIQLVQISVANVYIKNYYKIEII